MFKRLLVILMLIPLALVACSGAQPLAVVDDAAPAAVPQPEVELTQPDLTQPELTATTALQAPTGPQMECTLVSNGSNAPAELVAIFGVTADDWVQGPDTAAVTIVEYSDFQ